MTTKLKKVSEIADCEGCPMRRLNPDNTFVQPTIGTGRRIVVAEAPGETEQQLGSPLVGGSGRWFDAMLGKAGVRRDTLTIVNCINCRPPNNVFPTAPDAKSYISSEDGEKAVQHCYKAHVEPLLKARDWQRVDLLGGNALEIIAGKKEGIFKWRGSPVDIPALGNKRIGMPTLHPSAIMRDQSMLPVVINDLAKSTNIPPEHYNLFPSLEDVKGFTSDFFAYDIETAYPKDDITMIGLCAKPWYTMVVPFKGPYIAELRRIFSNAKVLIGQNILGFDNSIVEKHLGIKLDAEMRDIMLLHHLLFPDLPHDLELISSMFSGKPAWKHDKSLFQLYNARDVDTTMMAYLQLWPMAKQQKLNRLYELVQVPLAKICKLMHQTGFQIDPKRIGKVRDTISVEMAELENKLPAELRTQQVPIRKRQEAPAGTLSEKTGKPLKFIMVDATEEVVPWRSTQAVQKYLYETLGLDTQRNLKTDRVTSGKQALDRLYAKTHNPALLAIRKLRAMDELMTTFCKEEMLKVEKAYPHFNVHGTNSGRLSSSDPNLQNIPESTRHIYVPSVAGWKIIDVDYSGIESRITAYLANDTGRLANYLSIPNYSEHKYLASKITGNPYESIKKSADPDSPYSKAKHVVHGFNYGLGVKKCSMMYDMDFKETKKLFEMWAKEIPETVKWREATAAQAKRDGYLTTPFGRKRWFYTSSYYTESLSFLPQSTAADVIFRAMIGLMYERIDWPLAKVLDVVRLARPLPRPARLLLQVHDSLVFEAPASMVDECLRVITEVMTQPWPELGGFSVPIGVKIGDSWGGD